MFLFLSGIMLLSAEPEFRGLWVDAYHAGFRSAREADQLLREARDANFNALIVQVRRRGDALYESHLEPKANDVTPADFDPLAYLIQKAHDTNNGPRLEIHAWMVTYPIWDRRTTPPAQTNHPFLLHPDWLTKNADGETWNSANYVFDPGHPQVQQHTFDVAMDIIANYDVDGLNLDYIRYDGLSWGYNEVAVGRFNEETGRTGKPSPTDPEWMQWRRDQVTALVRKIYLSAAAIKPAVKVSADTICFAPGVTSVTGWTNASAAFTSVLQDWRGWMEEGILDINIPMTYFDHATNHRESWTNWSTFIKNHRYERQAVIGPGAFLNGVSNTLVQIQQTRQPTAGGNKADGVSLYSYYASNSENRPRSDLLAALVATNPPGVFSEPVETPWMPWKANPSFGHLKGTLALEGEPLRPAVDRLRLSGLTNEVAISPDATGFFGRVDLPPGIYRLIAARDGFLPVVTNVVIEPGKVAGSDLRLARLPAETPPIIALQPEDGAGLFGETITFQSVAAASTPVTYQWQFEGRPLDGATNSTLSLSSVDFTRAGRYELVLSNDFGVVTSEVAQLEVAAPEGIYAVRTAAGLDSSIINWRTSLPGDARVILRSGSNLVESLFLPDENSTNHSVRLGGLNPGTSYSMEIRSLANDTLFLHEGDSVRTAGDLVLDNTDAAFSGGWSTGTSAGGRFGPSYRFAGTTRNAATSTARYIPEITTPGYYDVEAWQPHGSNRSTNTPFILTYSGGSITNTVDQTRDGGRWLTLATDVPMAAGNRDGVIIANATGEGTKVVIADAIRFRYRENQDTPQGDALPAWWSLHFFGEVVPGRADLDGDLYSNHEEFLLGSDPTVTFSSVNVRSRLTEDGRLWLQFGPIQPDRVYRLEFSEGLYPAEWRTANGASLSPAPTRDAFFIVNPPKNRHLIFRITADLPFIGPMPASVPLTLN